MLLKQRIAEMNLARQRLDEEARTVTAGPKNLLKIGVTKKFIYKTIVKKLNLHT